jgi:enterobactin synthetase component D / holo-[acyl-carrier protein] synthase
VLERILPSATVVVATTGDLEASLFPEEAAALGRPVEKRRREFVTARACARRALAQLGLPERAVPSGPRGEPVWPDGVVGSITHCAGYRACALARAEDVVTIGVDAELDAPLPAGLLPDVALPEERRRLGALAAADPLVSWDRLLFSIKESIYKAWFPLARQWLGFEDAAVTIDPQRGTFSAQLLVPGPTVRGAVLDGFAGRWLAEDGLLLAAVALPARAPAAAAELAPAGELAE